ncbi:hypothetical protein HaLaN_07933, partial [Haematococcus lacustris]
MAAACHAMKHVDPWLQDTSCRVLCEAASLAPHCTTSYLPSSYALAAGWAVPWQTAPPQDQHHHQLPPTNNRQEPQLQSRQQTLRAWTETPSSSHPPSLPLSPSPSSSFPSSPSCVWHAAAWASYPLPPTLSSPSQLARLVVLPLLYCLAHRLPPDSLAKQVNLHGPGHNRARTSSWGPGYPVGWDLSHATPPPSPLKLLRGQDGTEAGEQLTTAQPPQPPAPPSPWGTSDRYSEAGFDGPMYAHDSLFEEMLARCLNLVSQAVPAMTAQELGCVLDLVARLQRDQAFYPEQLVLRVVAQLGALAGLAQRQDAAPGWIMRAWGLGRWGEALGSRGGGAEGERGQRGGEGVGGSWEEAGVGAGSSGAGGRARALLPPPLVLMCEDPGRGGPLPVPCLAALYGAYLMAGDAGRRTQFLAALGHAARDLMHSARTAWLDSLPRMSLAVVQDVGSRLRRLFPQAGLQVDATTEVGPGTKACHLGRTLSSSALCGG